MKNYKSFTLIEILIAMGIIGVISAIAAIGLKNIDANEIKIRLQKCYNHLNQSVVTLYTDEILYPKLPVTDSSNNIIRSNENGKYALMGLSNSYVTNETTGIPTSVANKFGLQMQNQTVGAINKYNKDKIVAFLAKDTSYWVVDTNTLQTATNATGYAIVSIDVNGLDAGPNCPVTGETLSTTSTATCTVADTFVFNVYANGEVKIQATTGTNFNQLEYLNNNKFLGDDEG